MSEVPGRRPTTLTAGSDHSMYCHVCPTVKATAYCIQCKIYLCPSCVGHHKLIPAIASHKLLQGDKFPSFYPAGHGENINQCPDHPDEDIKFYCPGHNLACCVACDVLDHKQCNVKYIRHICKNFETDLTKAIFQRQKDVKFSSYSVDIRDMAVVSPDTLLLSNDLDLTIQLVDCMVGRVVSEVSLQSSPSGLCLTKSEQAAVIVDGERVQLIEIRGKTITKGATLELKGDPLCVSTCGDTDLVISYNKAPWLEIVSTDGKVLKSGTMLHFKRPQFLTTSSDGYIYVSDSDTNKISKLNSSLQLLQTFSNSLMSAPGGIISITHDQMLVCSNENDSVLLLNTSTGKGYSLLRQQDGIVSPYSLSYCPNRKKLYVARQKSNILQVYMIR